MPRSAQRRLVSRVGFTESVGTALRAVRCAYVDPCRESQGLLPLFLFTDSGSGCPIRQSNATKRGSVGSCGFFCFTLFYTCMLCWEKRRVPGRTPIPTLYAPSSSSTPPLETDNATMCTSKISQPSFPRRASA